jgi:predicted Zn-dependent protease
MDKSLVTVIKTFDAPKQSRIKPVHIVNQPGLSALEKQAVIDGATEILRLAEVQGIELLDFGEWREEKYAAGGRLLDYQSVDWYIERARATSRNRRQLNADTLLNAICWEPWRDLRKGGTNHYDIFVVKDDMYSRDLNFVLGLGLDKVGTVISTHHFSELDNRMRYECIKSTVIHELGHVFGLIPSKRKKNVDKELGRHCANVCTMRQSLYPLRPEGIPVFSWEDLTNDRLNHGTFCGTCEKDLKQYFKE